MIRGVGRVLLVGLSLLLLIDLLLRSITSEIVVVERGLAALDAVALSQTALHRDVLRSRARLLRNYDPLVGEIGEMRDTVHRLAPLAALDPAALGPEITRLAAQVDEQEVLTEAFKTDNAILQNSLAFFPELSHEIAARSDARLAATVGLLTDAMLRLTNAPSREAMDELAIRLDRAASQELPEGTADAMRTLVAHGRLVLTRLPAVDASVAQLLASGISTQVQHIKAIFMQAHRRSEARAIVCRILLYVISVLLLTYLVHVYLRLHANASALAERSRSLQARAEFERLIATISARLIDMPLEQLDDRLVEALAALGQHAEIDRVWLMLHEGVRPGGRTLLAWYRDGLATPPVGWPQSAPTITAEVETAEAEARVDRDGAVLVPSVAALPEGTVRNVLEAAGIHTWLCVPVSYPGGEIGYLGLDAVRGPKHWAAEDARLVRLAGEIFASTLHREHIEREKAALEARLRQAQRLEVIGTLAGGIAHNFNNIIGGILGYAEMALARLSGEEPTRDYIEEIHKAGERARDLVDQILASGRRRIEQRQDRVVDMAWLLEEAVRLLRVSLPASVEFRVRTAAAEPLLVFGDPTQLQQVIINLCTNAAQAMSLQGIVELGLALVHNGASRPLSHGELMAGYHVQLSVSDSGEGMDRATMERIFEPFFTTKPAGHGTGLGLATVYRIVSEQGGAINVQSRKQEGTCFDIYFRAASEMPVVSSRPNALPPVGNGATVMIIDDDAAVLTWGEDALAALGYEPVGFPDGAEALAALHATPERFDLVIADQVMPGITGLQLAAAIHEAVPDLPVVLAADADMPPIEVGHLRAAGVLEVFRKPLRSVTLAEVLARHLHPPLMGRVPS